MTQTSLSAQRPAATDLLHEETLSPEPEGIAERGQVLTAAASSIPALQRRAVFGQDLTDLQTLMTGHGQKAYRARQLFDALYRQRVSAWDDVTVLPADLRARFAADGIVLGIPEIVQTARSIDGTERYLVRMADGETVETVWMPDGDGGERGDGSAAADEERDETVSAAEALSPEALDESSLLPGRTTRPDLRNAGALAALGLRRATICVSSQVGCAVNCQFCLTAKLGIRRNLTAGEIAGQVVAVLNRHAIKIGRDRINLVFMGMGEPFLNYDSFMRAVRLLVEGVGIPESRMTVSTSGIEPAIRRFAAETVRPKLALSLNASNDAVREAIMPITRKWNISALLEACRSIPLRPREWVTFEYVLLGGVNDGAEHAREVLELLCPMKQAGRGSPEGGVQAKVNLIVWNPGPGIAYKQPRPADVERFQKLLIAGGVPTYIRRPRGRDIYAACGQLKRTTEPVASPSALVEIAAAG